jgi:flagellar hook-associated protein 3 FlgL
MNLAQQQLSSGKRINLPSDDPTGTAQAFSLHNHLASLDQNQKIIQQAQGYLNATDSAMGGVTNLLRQARTIAVQASSDTITDESKQALAKQVQSIIQSLGTIGNSTYGSRYLFAGQRNDAPPYVANGENFTYQGGSAKTQDGDIRLDIGVGESVRINASGDEAITPAINALANLRDRIRGGKSAEISTLSLKEMDDAIQQNLSVRSDVGTRSQHLQQILQRNDAAKVNFSRILSDIEDTDIPKAVVELQSAQTAYQAALQSTARIGQISLLDFLR